MNRHFLCLLPWQLGTRSASLALLSLLGQAREEATSLRGNREGDIKRWYVQVPW